MSGLRRDRTPLMGGIPSLEASNQAQIDDLVQRNRTLEYTLKKANDQLEQEKLRTKDAVLEIQRRWDENQQHWKEGFQDVLASFRVAQSQLEVEVEKERAGILKEMKITREEKLQRMQRDYKITLFQIKEEELDRRIEELEEEQRVLEESHALVVERMRVKCADYVIQLKETQVFLSRNERDNEEKEAKLNKLHEEHANLHAQKENLQSKWERTKLQLDGIQTKYKDAERSNEEFQRVNADLTRQLDQWQNLETKEGEAAAAERKLRIAVELELRELKEKMERRGDVESTALAKEKSKVEKLKASLDEWRAHANDNEEETRGLGKQVSKLQKQVEKLRSVLEVERSRVRPPSPQKPPPSPPPNNMVVDNDVVETEEVPPKPKGKPTIKKPNITDLGAESSRTARKSTGGRPPPKPIVPQAAGSDVEEVADSSTEEIRSKKGMGKQKAVEVEVPPKHQRKKRKGPPEDDGNNEVEVVEQTKPARKARAASVVREPAATTGRARSKPASRAGSRQPSVRPGAAKDRDEGDDASAPKKKRKINIFPTSKDSGQFELSLANFGDGGLNIPSVLSPLKEGEVVPQRSTATVGAQFGIWSPVIFSASLLQFTIPQ